MEGEAYVCVWWAATYAVATTAHTTQHWERGSKCCLRHCCIRTHCHHHNLLLRQVLPGLYLCGEVLDVFGRIGGFNFWWAWLSGRMAGQAAAAAVVGAAASSTSQSAGSRGAKQKAAGRS